jgi:putative tryptophan/tyrosine transport system substrate-binding protein
VRRRDFIMLVGGAVAGWPLGARAQQGRQRKIGFLCLGTPNPKPFLEALRAGLHDLGYDEGKDFQLEVRSAGGSAGSLASLASNLVASKMDVIVAFQTPAATAAKLATTDVPIVMYVADPVRQGLVKSLSRPGGNLTGVDPAGAETTEKNLEIVCELLPSVQRVAILANASDPFHEPFLEHIKSAAGELKIEINPIMVHSADELNADFTDIVKWRAEAVLVQPSITQRGIADLALQYRIPAIGVQALVELGGLASYTANPEALYRRCADFVDKILRGARPADLPIELPTKFLLAINLQTAKALGIKVPQTILARADRLIE